jgi:hypothetical protein
MEIIDYRISFFRIFKIICWQENPVMSIFFKKFAVMNCVNDRYVASFFKWCLTWTADG